MRVVIDTNVFVSGIFWKGPPNRILNAWRDGKFQLVVTVEIMEEYRRVLRELAEKRSGINVDRFLELVGLNALAVKAPVFARPVCSDPDDDKFLAAALAGKADYVVTGDKALLKISEFRGATIVTPAQLLKLAG
jgi:uncharacterized protein